MSRYIQESVKPEKESKEEIRRYKKIIKWKAEVLDTMKAQSKALRFVS